MIARLIAAIRAWNNRRLIGREMRKHPDYKRGWDWAERQVNSGYLTATSLADSFEKPCDEFSLGVFESASSIAADEDRFVW